jgi:two-component system cell cycle sensor histidine kinase/response regulator CckA
MDRARATKEQRTRKAAKTGRGSEANFEAAFQTASIPMSIARLRDAVLIEVNDAFCRQTGYSRSEVIGHTAEERGLLVDPQQRQRAMEAIREHGAARGMEFTVRSRDGEVRNALLSASIIEMDGEPCLLAATLDVTERRLAEEAIRASEAKFAAAFGFAGVMMSISRLRDGLIVDVNRAFLEQTGFRREDVVGKTSRELGLFADPADRDRMIEILRQTGQVRDLEVQMPTRDGELNYALLSADEIDIEGEPHLILATVNLTERRQVEEKLRASESRYRNLFEQTADAVVVLDEEARIADANPALATMLGRSIEELRGAPWTDYIDNLDEVPFQRPAVDGPALVFERRLRRPDGSSVELEFHTRRFAPGWSIGVGREIGARKAAERERARLIRAIEQSADAIAITDPAGTILYVNPALERTSRMTREQAIGQNHRALLSEALSDGTYAEIMATIGRDGHWSGELDRTRPGGSTYFAHVTVTAVNDESGALANYVVVLRDLTHEHELEEQLRHAQKMEAIGRLAGGVAHDFNNLLTAISGFAELAAVEAEPGSELAGYLDEILQSAGRAGALTRQLLAFGRRAVLQPQVLDVNEVVAQISPMLRRIIGEDVSLEITPGKTVGRVMVDRGQLEQVIVNLAANARDAMPAGGRLTIATEGVTLDETCATGHRGLEPGEHARLSFTDTGSGMDAATIEHIFEPFFTTKMAGRGMGLGLSTVFGIVRQSGGLVSVRSTPGQGSTFTVDLPVTQETAEPVRETPRVESQPGYETVLVVEDEPSVLGFVSQLLKRNGYTVLDASNGDEAVAIAKSHPGPIDLLFCDLVMPGLSGRETASVIRTMRPGARELFCSGYSEEMARHGTADEFPFVAKPYDADTLLRAIREALAG